MNTLNTNRTQIETIRQHLLQGKSITPATAMLVYGISRLSSVIERLRNRGMDIVTVMKRDEMGRQYSEYKLAPELKRGCSVVVKRGHGIGLPKWVRRSKAARVVGLYQDVAHVEFVRGTRIEVHPLNVKELACVA